MREDAKMVYVKENINDFINFLEELDNQIRDALPDDDYFEMHEP